LITRRVTAIGNSQGRAQGRLRQKGSVLRGQKVLSDTLAGLVEVCCTRKRFLSAAILPKTLGSFSVGHLTGEVKERKVKGYGFGVEGDLEIIWIWLVGSEFSVFRRNFFGFLFFFFLSLVDCGCCAVQRNCCL